LSERGREAKTSIQNVHPENPSLLDSQREREREIGKNLQKTKPRDHLDSIVQLPKSLHDSLPISQLS